MFEYDWPNGSDVTTSLRQLRGISGESPYISTRLPLPREGAPLKCPRLAARRLHTDNRSLFDLPHFKVGASRQRYAGGATRTNRYSEPLRVW